MNVNKKLIFVIIIIAKFCPIHAQWNRIDFLQPKLQNLYSVKTFGEERFIAVGDSGTILLSDFSGKNWKVVETGVKNNLREVFVTENNTFWVVGSNGMIMKSVASGITWEKNYITQNQLNSIFFVNENKGWVCGNNHFVGVTNDGGLTWNEADQMNLALEVKDYCNNFNTILFVDSLIGFAGGDAGNNEYIIKTIDGGITWNTVFLPVNYRSDVSQIFSFDNLIIYVLVGRRIYRTMDFGISWEWDWFKYWYSSCSLTENDKGIAVGQAIINYTFGGEIIVNQLLSSLIYDIDFSSKYCGIAVGSYGQILRTVNEGKHWENSIPWAIGKPQIGFLIDENKYYFSSKNEIFKLDIANYIWEASNSPSTKDIIVIHFLNEDIGFIASAKIIYKTSDGGKTWTEVFQISDKYLAESNFSFRKIQFVSDKVGWISGSLFGILDHVGQIFSTTDGGDNWNLQKNGGDLLKEFDFIDELNGWTIEGSVDYQNSVIVKTNDAGKTWKEIKKFDGRSIGYLDFLNEKQAYMASDDLYKTNDGGLNWINITTPELETEDVIWEEITVTDTSNIWLILKYRLEDGTWSNTKLFHSSNSGFDWQEQIISANSGIADIQFLNKSTGMAITKSGELFYTNNGGVTFVDDKKDLILTKFQLKQNYPNPFNPTTTIEYSLPEREYASIIVYDLLGNKVIELINEENAAGKYKVQFDGSNFSSGIYFYRFTSGDFSQTKKFVLLK